MRNFDLLFYLIIYPFVVSLLILTLYIALSRNIICNNFLFLLFELLNLTSLVILKHKNNNK